MTDFTTVLANLRRPRILFRAARLGLEDYRRDRDLRRLIGASPSTEKVMARLLVEEERLEAARLSGDASYPLARHIDVLIALMAEVRLLPRKLAV